MKKIILLLLFIMFFLISFSQKYPIQTILKGDSVVILTTEQYKDYELLLSNQKNRVNFYKNEISQKLKEIDSLKNELNKRDKFIDTLNIVINNKNYLYDSLKYKHDTIIKWLYEISIDNGYVYYSYRDSTVMSIDLSSYVLIGYKKGNFSLVRRGPVYDDNKWKSSNRSNKEEPKIYWDLYFEEKWRPTIIKLPYKIIL